MNSKPPLNFLVAGLFAVTVFFFRVDQAFLFGSQFPVSDQWTTEYAGLYKKYVEGSLGVRDFLTPNMEHTVALLKIVHLLLFVLLGEWNLLAQMVFNAGLFAGLIGALVYFFGTRVGYPFNRVLQLFLLAIGMLPIASENYLWGFQTAWYLYYPMSLGGLWCLYRSQSFDWYWISAYVLAILSCLCLAAGVLNLFLCIIIPAIKRFLDGSRPTAVLYSLAGGVLMILLPMGFVVMQALSVGSEHAGARTIAQFSAASLTVFAFPLLLIPVTYAPTLMGTWLLFRSRIVTGPCPKISLGLLFSWWALLHAFIIVAGRGGFSGRHSELLMLGVIANAAVLPAIFGDSRYTLFRVRTQLPAAICVFWIAAMVGGLALQSVRTARNPSLFEHSFSARQEVLARCEARGSFDDLKRRSWGPDWETGAPIHLLTVQPELLEKETLKKVLPTFYRSDVQLNPKPLINLVIAGDTMFAEPFPHLLWFRLDHATGATRQLAEARNIESPWIKIAWAGRSESSATGLYSPPRSENHLRGQRSFSQPDGWKVVFLPVVDSQVVFEANVSGPFDWLLVQKPIPVSHAQYLLESFARRARSLWAFSLGASTFLFTAVVGFEVVRRTRAVTPEQL